MTTEEFDKKFSKIGGVFTSESKRIACEIGDLKGLLNVLAVKNFNCCYTMTQDENLAYQHIINFALDSGI